MAQTSSSTQGLNSPFNTAEPDPSSTPGTTEWELSKNYVEEKTVEQYLLQFEELVTTKPSAAEFLSSEHIANSEENHHPASTSANQPRNTPIAQTTTPKSSIGRLSGFEGALILLLRKHHQRLNENHSMVTMENSELEFELEQQKYSCTYWQEYALALMDVLEKHNIPLPMRHGYENVQRGYSTEPDED
ncbi:hypothetical protein V5O48_006917 [Marasmius crinis-equi]|uniref:Uncharacterized protein n=1 Tax=Marasmius crinis-equi TaxID=585013 RepID=A0ABR3FI76_9AGAR